MKGKSHIIPRMKTFDQLMKGKKPGKPKILTCLSPVPDEPAAITMQKDLMSGKTDSAACFFVPVTGAVTGV